MANSMLCMVLLALINFSITLSESTEKILIAIDSSGISHNNIGTVSPGQWIKIQCPHTGAVKWSRSSFRLGSITESLQSSDKTEIIDNQLKINNINFVDSGVYYCEQNAVAYRFYLHVLAITKTINGTVPTTNTSTETNGVLIKQTKLDDRKSANVSCHCDNGTNNTLINIIWKGGLYEKWSDLYTIVTVRTDTGISSTLILKKATNNKDLYGEYTCSCSAVSNAKKESKVYMEVPPIFDDNEPSVRKSEGVDVILSCNVWGYPAIDPSTIKWSFQNNELIRDGIKISQNDSMSGYSQLMFTKVTSADRGVYTCSASNAVGHNSMSTMLRVKSRYAALWPFIGILIQLAILITIIAVYEWKKSQKSKEDNTKCNFDSRNDPDAMATERSAEPDSVRQRLVKT